MVDQACRARARMDPEKATGNQGKSGCPMFDHV